MLWWPTCDGEDCLGGDCGADLVNPARVTQIEDLGSAHDYGEVKRLRLCTSAPGRGPDYFDLGLATALVDGDPS